MSTNQLRDIQSSNPPTSLENKHGKVKPNWACPAWKCQTGSFPLEVRPSALVFAHSGASPFQGFQGPPSPNNSKIIFFNLRGCFCQNFSRAGCPVWPCIAPRPPQKQAIHFMEFFGYIWGVGGRWSLHPGLFCQRRYFQDRALLALCRRRPPKSHTESRIKAPQNSTRNPR